MMHHVGVMRPAKAPLGTRGQPQGNPQTIIKNWPCRIVQTGATETDQSGGVVAAATFEVDGFADSQHPILHRDYLLFNGRKLEVSSVSDPDQRGVKVVLGCGELLEGATSG